jgi:hypothetical protein
MNTEKTEQTERDDACKTLFRFVISVRPVFSVLIVFAAIEFLID